MILWRLCGYWDPEQELHTGELVCQAEKRDDGYLLTVEHSGEMIICEILASIQLAAAKADALRETLLEQGWSA